MPELGVRPAFERGRTGTVLGPCSPTSLQSGAEHEGEVTSAVVFKCLIVHKQFRANQSASGPNFKAFRSKARRASSVLTVVPETELTQVQITQRNHRRFVLAP
jgi:hypothetical protein